MPVERYLLDNAQQSTLGKARDVLIQQCMRRFGLRYPSAHLVTTDSPDGDAADMARRYGVTDPVVAARYGYHPASGTALPPPASALDDDQKTVLLGQVYTFHGKSVPTQGCSGEADRKLGPGVDEQEAEQLDSLSYTQSLKSSPLEAAFGSWSRCMAATGQHYPTPIASGNDPRWATAMPTSAEKRTATADARCKESADVVPIWLRTETGIQDSAIASHRAGLTRLHSAEQASLQRAQAVLKHDVG
ncbi:hypothetical protein K7472_07460 [Streptomyces sp. PTM05]|uniref:Uncharacterized protein n=1 Tax=Streptantibioticus parmotrematis TaxID=2873249 RepID=A0ABS7QNC9_9ACTN|nr:hypothetical protein [Streptantibioticus parmotrematis]MBY8884681.1 hypothetical protein [Streptantibioticus parmotrematis]